MHTETEPNIDSAAEFAIGEELTANGKREEAIGFYRSLYLRLSLTNTIQRRRSVRFVST